MSYNGWTNRETWLINVWYEPQTRADVEFIWEVVENQYDEMPDGPFKDMIDIMAINWNELLEQFKEETAEDDDYLDSDAHLSQVE